MSYETIYEGEDANNAMMITFTHVSTRLKDRPDATLNHFDGILIEPTAEQKQRIASLLAPASSLNIRAALVGPGAELAAGGELKNVIAV